MSLSTTQKVADCPLAESKRKKTWSERNRLILFVSHPSLRSCIAIPGAFSFASFFPFAFATFAIALFTFLFCFAFSNWASHGFLRTCARSNCWPQTAGKSIRHCTYISLAFAFTSAFAFVSATITVAIAAAAAAVACTVVV